MHTINIGGMWGLINVLKMHFKHRVGKMNNLWEEEVIPESNTKLRAERKRWAFIVVFGQVLMAALFVWLKEYSLLFIVTLAPFTAAWLNVLCERTQHAGLSPNVPDFRLNYRTVILQPFVSFLYWKINYHIEHHMYPAILFFKLNTLRTQIESELPSATRGLWSTWKEMISIAKRQKTDPSFVFVPSCPAPKNQWHPLNLSMWVQINRIFDI